MSSTERRAPERALLAAGTASYDCPDFEPLDKVPDALKAVVGVLRELGFSSVARSPGYRLDPAVKSLSEAAERAAAAAPVVVLYYTGHGAEVRGDTYYLVSKKSWLAKLPNSALAVRDLLRQLYLRDDRMQPLASQPTVLVILDCCQSEAAGQTVLTDALRGIGNPNTWVMASAGRLEYARQGAFAKAFCDALRQPANGASQPFVSMDGLAGAVKAALAGTRQEPWVFPPQGRFRETPPFFPNKDSAPGLAGLTVAEQQHWLDLVRGNPEESTTGFYLTGETGRLRAAEDLATWMTDPRDLRLAVVTGGPGAGKSALLALPVLLTHQDQRRHLLTAGTPLIRRMADRLPVGTSTAAVCARGLNTDQAAQGIAQALGRRAATAAELLEDLLSTPEPRRRVVIVDAVDEALSPATLQESLALLSRRPGVRVVIGARPDVLDGLADRDLTIDLDAAGYRDPDALISYIHRLLTAAEEPGVNTQYQADGVATAVTAAVARAIAERATDRTGAQSFLVARLFARSVRAQPQPDITRPGWASELMASAAAAIEQDIARLGANPYPARLLLEALAWAKGPGLPWETIWVPVATALAQEAGEANLPSNDHVRRLLDQAGAYVVEDRGAGQRSVYRPFHNLLAAHLRGEPAPGRSATWEPRRHRTERAIYDALLAAVPSDGRGSRDWVTAHPYVRTYLAQHAAAAGTATLAALAQDTGFLAVADPLTLSPLLSPADPALRDVAHIYRRARPRLGGDARANAAYLHEASRRDDSLPGHDDLINALAFGVTPGGQLLLASADWDGTVRLRDPITGAPVGDPLPGHKGGVSSVAFGVTAGGQLLLASAGWDGTVRLWDPVTGAPAGDPLPGHTGGMNSVAFGTSVGGQLLLAAAGDEGLVRLWDPVTDASAGDLLPGHTGGIGCVAFGVTAGGQLLLAAAGDEGLVRLWDPVTGASAGAPLAGHVGWVNSVAFGVTAGGQLLLASAGSDGTVRLWDPVTGAPAGDPLPGHTGGMNSVAFGTTAGGQLLLASATDAGLVRLWDPVTGAPAGDPLPGHAGWLNSVAFGTTGGGQLLLASAGDDGMLRLWDPLISALSLTTEAWKR